MPPPNGGAFEKLTEDEVAFCWRSVAEQGQLSAARLQEFMQEICGEKLSLVQAKDLLNYMDANGDGRVGMEDFRNFMSIGRLADTDPKSFMWKPKAKYREEQQACDSHRQSEMLNARAAPSILEVGRRFSLASLAADSIDEEREEPRSGARALPHTLQDLNPPTPPSALEAPCPKTPSSFGSHGVQATQSPRGSIRPGRNSRRPTQLAHKWGTPSEPDTQLRPEPPRTEPEVRRPRPPKADPDPKLLAKIEAALEKYEQASWQRLLREESATKRRLFAQFAAEADSWELSASEFHRMLTKWQHLARWSLPGQLRVGDSLAALEYFLQRERNSRGTEPGSPVAAVATDEPAVEAKLPFHVWLDILAGKYRPEEHSS